MSMQINGNENRIAATAERMEGTKVTERHEVAGTGRPAREVMYGIADDVTISSEGMRSYRDSRLQDEIDKLGNTNVMLTSYGYLLSSKLPSDYGEPDANGDYHRINRTIEERADNMLKAYAEVYDEIQKGYADGTREIYIRDENAENGIRKLTKDEEIAELDKAFEGMAKRLENQRKATEALSETADKIAKLVTDRPTAAAQAAPELKKRKQEYDKLPEDLSRNIIDAAKTFVGKYNQMKPKRDDIDGILCNISIFGNK